MDAELPRTWYCGLKLDLGISLGNKLRPINKPMDLY